MNRSRRFLAGVYLCLLLILAACGDAPTATPAPTPTATAIPPTNTPAPTATPAAAPSFQEIRDHINAIWAGSGTGGERKFAFDDYTLSLAGQKVDGWPGWLIGLDPAVDNSYVATISVDDPFSGATERVQPTPNPADIVLDVHVPEFVRLAGLSADQVASIHAGDPVQFSGTMKQVDYYFDIDGAALTATPANVPTPGPVPADLLISMERTPCAAKCPAYKISVAADGTVQYEGISDTSLVGTQSATISAAQVAELASFFDRVGFGDLPASYGQNDCPRIVADAPDAYVSITRDGKTTSVQHYHGNSCAPIKLNMLEYKIDEITNSQQWVRYPDTGARPTPGS